MIRTAILGDVDSMIDVANGFALRVHGLGR